VAAENLAGVVVVVIHGMVDLKSFTMDNLAGVVVAVIQGMVDLRPQD
jgi:hypothetical protein